MSIPVEVADLAEALTRFGAGYLLTVGTGGRVKAVTVQPEVVDGLLVVTGPGRGSSANISANPAVTLLFPPAEPRGFTLLVDGTAELDGDTARVTPASAVLHRPAAHADEPPAADGCGQDCRPGGVSTSGTARVDPPLATGEVETLRAFLDYHRDTLRLKTEGLDAAQLAATLPPSTMTLGGLLKHLALVEDHWFGVMLLGHEDAPHWRDVDWDADPDWEWHSAAQDGPLELRRLFDEAVAASDRCLDEAVADGGLDRLSARESRHEGEGRFSARWIVLHMIEEYARHNGHADLLRESVDGATGE